jgi:hypothetical protein
MKHQVYVEGAVACLYVKNEMGHDLMISHCLMHQENLCAQPFKMMYFVALFTKFVKE